MKIISFIIFLIFNLLNVCEVFCCGEHINCPVKKRAYRFCDGNGHIVTLCAENPFDFDGGMFYSGYTKVLKLKDQYIPLCLEFDNSGPNNNILASICGSQQCSTGIIYVPNDFTVDMQAAVDAWKCICGWGEDDCACTVHIGFVSKNHFEFTDPANDFASNSVDLNIIENMSNFENDIGNNGSFNNDCEISCNDLNIYLGAVK